MTRARRPLPIAALLCAVALAGCGSGGSSSSAKTTSTSAASGSQTQGTGTSTAPADGSPQVKGAVTRCKQIIQAESKLPASAKRKLEGACAQAAKGNTTAVKAVAREVCEEVIDTSSVPNGTAKETALKACRQ